MNILDPIMHTWNPATDKYSGMEPKTRAFLEELAASDGKPVETLGAEEARKTLSDLQGSVEVELGNVTTESREIATEGHSIHLMVVKPADIAVDPPVIMFFHGGGWVLGDFPTHQRLVHDLCIMSNCAVVFVDYARAPEVQYPAALIECYLATKWVAQHGSDIGVDGSRLVVAGNSAGGNVATVVCLMAKEKREPLIRHQTLFWPVADASFDTGSYADYADGYFLTRNMMKWFWDSYLDDQEARREIYASPVRATLEQLSDLPPALIQTAEFDVLRDEGEAYAHRLSDAGVTVMCSRYLGVIHDFGLLNPLARTPQVHAAILQAAGEIRKYI
ncbi:Acetyl esterase/lipase [Methylobacillus rhizosphaerae]|uniref:Acetyl esterase/lipase n=1 Tax=Methylobacillus rhizosphaerae TaxID=551994 RepID=A0A239AG10_9PROT|nr:alpha/beta hydrolase [Methylobacillus rhizosphaerae]SNR94490.1 Acetyl esterase/lipase [Methylobacillus rhizosphaerae]